MKKKEYDVVICGAGAAGLLFAYRLNQDPFFKNHSVLLIEAAPKNTNDRTWAFWEKQSGPLEEIVYHRWEQGLFNSKSHRQELHFQPYTYKMIRGIDFYNHIRPRLEKNPQMEWVQTRVSSFVNQQESTLVQTELGSVVGKKVFSSIYHESLVKNQKKYPLLQQHFVGWVVKTTDACFDSNKITFMDFDVPESKATRFMYILPFSANKALLEDTFFSSTLLSKEIYETAIKNYLKRLGVTSYEIQEREQGSIPMTVYPFHQHNTSSLLHIGTAGGWTKASTGYTFQNTLSETARLIEFLKSKASLDRFHQSSKFEYYDMLFLDVLARYNERGSELFSLMFQKNPVQRIFKFLSNETGFWEDLLIMRSFPIRWFISAFWKRLF